MDKEMLKQPSCVEDFELPRCRICHICGRQYGIHSFEIHLKQCKELWRAREALKEKSDRKAVPKSPDILNGERDLNEINRLASEIYNKVSLSTCAHCGRSFLTERLVLHNTSCTAENPGKRITGRADLNTPEEAEERERERRLRPRWNVPQIRRGSALNPSQNPQNMKYQTSQRKSNLNPASGKGCSGGIKCRSERDGGVSKNDIDFKTQERLVQTSTSYENKEESVYDGEDIMSVSILQGRAVDESESMTVSETKEYSSLYYDRNRDCTSNLSQRESYEIESMTFTSDKIHDIDTTSFLVIRVEEMESTIATLKNTIMEMQLQFEELKKSKTSERTVIQDKSKSERKEVMKAKKENMKSPFIKRVYTWLTSAHS